MQQASENKTRVRSDLRCLSLGHGDIWDKAKQLAQSEGRSVSSFLRELIKQAYNKKKRKLLETA